MKLRQLQVTFMKTAAPLTVLALSAGMAFAHGDHDEAPAVSFDPAVICDSATSLHNAQDDCYGVYADNMVRYAAEASSAYMQATTLDELAAVLRRENPTSLEIKEEESAIIARWFDETANLHRDGDAAYKKITLGESYTELWMRHGVSYRDNNMPVFMNVEKDVQIDLLWNDEEGGMHNEHGPAQATNDQIKEELNLFWALHNIPQSQNGSPTWATISLKDGANIAVFQQWQSGDGIELQRMHRHDCVFNLDRDPETGIVTRQLSHFHDRNQETADEIEKEMLFDGKTGEPTGTNWYYNGIEIPEPEGFVLSEDHYCQDPDYSVQTTPKSAAPAP